jgi:Na+/H+ antiporter NhaD/arsenite permease-like protein
MLYLLLLSTILLLFLVAAFLKTDTSIIINMTLARQRLQCNLAMDRRGTVAAVGVVPR